MGNECCSAERQQQYKQSAIEKQELIKARAAQHYQAISEWSKQTYNNNLERYQNGAIEY